MKILLLQNVPKIGQKGEIKEVNEGFARNALLPRKLALIADAKVIAKAKADQKAEKIRHELFLKQVKEKFESLGNKEIEIISNKNEKGHLFAKIHSEDILIQVNAQTGIELEKNWLKYDDSIKEVGEYKIDLYCENITGKVTVVVK